MRHLSHSTSLCEDLGPLGNTLYELCVCAQQCHNASMDVGQKMSPVVMFGAVTRSGGMNEYIMRSRKVNCTL